MLIRKQILTLTYSLSFLCGNTENSLPSKNTENSSSPFSSIGKNISTCPIFFIYSVLILKTFLLIILQTVDARGPREPWHDLHSKIDGPAAYDVLQNFQERWLKAAKRHGIKKLAKSYDDALLSIERIPEIININDAIYFSDNDPETWHVQVIIAFLHS